MIATLSLLQIQRVCGDMAFRRGQGYQQQGRVLSIELEERSIGLEVVKSKVAGTGSLVYEQVIELRNHSKQHVEIDGECTCPVGYDCKHVAAVLIELLKQRRSDPVAEDSEAQIESWFKQLKKASISVNHAAEEIYPEAVRYRLVYVLEPDLSNVDAQGLQIAAYKVRLLKAGGYGKPSGFALEKANDEYYSHQFLQPADQDIARLLTTNNSFYYSNYQNAYALKRQLGELALQKMLETGRCHWGAVEGPLLQLAPPRPIEFDWEPVDGGRQLSYQVTPAAAQLSRIDIMWYIDTETGAVGPLQHPSLVPAQMVVLLKAPIVPDKALQSVSRRLVMETPEYDVEPPAELDMERRFIAGVELQPVLRLVFSPSRAEGKAQPQHHARLAFRYDDVVLDTISEHPMMQFSRDDVLYKITRDLETEYRCIQQLEELGMSPLGIEGEHGLMDWGYGATNQHESAMMWMEFLDHDRQELKQKGWQVSEDASFQITFSEAEDWEAEVETTGEAWFSLSLGIEIDGRKVNMLPLLVDILAQAGSPSQLNELLTSQEHFLLPLEDHHWLKISTSRVKPIFDTLVELYDQKPLNDEGAIALSRVQGAQLNALLNNPALRWKGADELRELNNKLRNFKRIEPVVPPDGFNADLRGYQVEGISWLHFLQGFGFNGILADDMGLGKTIQTLAHLLQEKQSGRQAGPNLVIAPTSLMGNWRKEAERFAPELRVVVLHGTQRHRLFQHICDYDVVLTTYPLLRRDKDVLLETQFHTVVLDEAQAIKNPKSQTTRTVFDLKAQHRLCLTGTPLENHLGELWSMFHFLMPGFLGTLERFNRLYRYPIEKHADFVRAEQLRQRIKPFLLRRTKEEVATELPEKTEIIRTVTLTGSQRDLYESIRLAMDKKVRDEINSKGFARSQIMILDALLKLRQVCCDPRLVNLPGAGKVEASAKLDLLMDMLPEMIEEGRRILIFSQFTSMLKIIEEALDQEGISYALLTGQTRKREEAIARFQDRVVPVFLISLKAGGVGLNLTAADTVIHYDPWWNPAAENQATDRAHRIGQDKAVFVYKLISEDTVEDKILSLQQKKQALADSIYDSKVSKSTERFSAEDLENLFQPLGD